MWGDNAQQQAAPWAGCRLPQSHSLRNVKGPAPREARELPALPMPLAQMAGSSGDSPGARRPASPAVAPLHLSPQSPCSGAL